MKTVLVTGAGRGIGLAVAKKFSSMGWNVLSLDKEFQATVIGERIKFDLRSLDKIPELIGRLGPIDTLVNNAAVLFCDAMDSIPQDHIQEILEVNLLAPARLIESVSLGMRSRGGGRIVSVGSVSAFTGHPDLWYGATKAALLNLTKSYASHLGRDNIFVNAVAPGPTLTTMYEQLPESRKESVMRSVHSGRPCLPEEVAETIFWLGAESPAYVSGTTVDVNGGSYPR
ncbi:MAG: SDR family NAD(P)-dependent oxidoreductase [Burkholderiales bacterium]|jgi:NAD(P)-dependent dehydrogenase (short-subunit alcohol dehydrogenase family)